MKRIAFILVGLATFTLPLLPLPADTEPTAFEKALYDRARYDILSKLSDEDFVSYCVTMGLGGDTLLKLHDEIMVKQIEQSNLITQGFNGDNPQMTSVNESLKDLRAQYVVKIAEARKGLEVESKIAEETLSSLPQTSR